MKSMAIVIICPELIYVKSLYDINQNLHHPDIQNQ